MLVLKFVRVRFGLWVIEKKLDLYWIAQNHKFSVTLCWVAEKVKGRNVKSYYLDHPRKRIKKKSYTFCCLVTKKIKLSQMIAQNFSLVLKAWNHYICGFWLNLILLYFFLLISLCSFHPLVFLEKLADNFDFIFLFSIFLWSLGHQMSMFVDAEYIVFNFAWCWYCCGTWYR